MFRKITVEDEAVYIELLREFYHSPADSASDTGGITITARLRKRLIDSPIAEAYLFEQVGR